MKKIIALIVISASIAEAQSPFNFEPNPYLAERARQRESALDFALADAIRQKTIIERQNYINTGNIYGIKDPASDPSSKMIPGSVGQLITDSLQKNLRSIEIQQAEKAAGWNY
jgi:hypothetical protein